VILAASLTGDVHTVLLGVIVAVIAGIVLAAWRFGLRVRDVMHRVDARTKYQLEANGGQTNSVSDRIARVEETGVGNSRSLVRIEDGQHVQDSDRNRIGRDVANLSGKVDELAEAQREHVDWADRMVAEYKASLAEQHGLSQHGDVNGTD
jgi:hypothetical protein